jgi:hypothetical protein
VVPKSAAGRIVAGVVMLVGIGFFAILTAAIAATFVKQNERRRSCGRSFGRFRLGSNGSSGP